jgi:beta-lactam-binding protein with PASTA domain
VFKFITEKPFWVNLIVAIAIFFILIFTILQLLGSITNHGKYLSVPSVVGKKTEQAIKFLESKGFDVEIQDSVYTDTAKMGIVLRQIPDPNSTVKINRTILLTVNRMTLPLIDMPALEGKSLNFALDILRRSHLKLGDTIYKPDFMRGSIIEQRYRGGKITPGSKIPWGSAIDLVVGSGLNLEPILVPDLLGLTFAEANSILQENGITIGAILADPGITDTASAYVWKQNPPKLNEQNEPVFIQAGQIMDLWISTERRVERDSTIH